MKKVFFSVLLLFALSDIALGKNSFGILLMSMVIGQTGGITEILT